MRLPVFIAFLATTLLKGILGIPLAIPDNPKEYQLRRLSLLGKMDFDIKLTYIQDDDDQDIDFHSRDNDPGVGRDEDGGIFAYGHKIFYGSMGSRTTEKYIQRGTSWDNVFVDDEDDNGEDTKRGFITVDVIPADTVDVQNQTPAFDVREAHNLEVKGRDEEGYCATCLKRDSGTKSSELNKVFVHWSKDFHSGSSGDILDEGDTVGKSDTDHDSKWWDKRTTHLPERISKRMERANSRPKCDPKPVRGFHIDEEI